MLRRCSPCLVSLALVFSAIQVRAEDCGGFPAPSSKPTARGVSVGLRTAWGLPMGSREKGDAMGANFGGMIVPVWLDGGYRLSEAVYLGGYFQWGVPSVSDEICPKNLSCSASDVRAGLNVH